MMYEHILVAIEHSRADAAILGHIEGLARMTGARLLLVHVADGFAARHFDDLNLRESDEIKQDRVYLHKCRVDLIAMSTHGHRFFKDVIHGTTVDRVRHTVKVPVLLLRGLT